MPKIDVDLSKVESLRRLPSGLYVLQVNKIEEGESQNNKPKLNFGFGIIAPQEIFQLTRTFNFSFSLDPKALYRLKDFAEATGRPIRAGNIQTEDWQGAQVGADILWEETKDFGVQNRVNTWFRLTPNFKPEVKDQAKFREMIAAITAGGAGAAAPSAPAQA